MDRVILTRKVNRHYSYPPSCKMEGVKEEANVKDEGGPQQKGVARVESAVEIVKLAAEETRRARVNGIAKTNNEIIGI